MNSSLWGFFLISISFSNVNEGFHLAEARLYLVVPPIDLLLSRNDLLTWK